MDKSTSSSRKVYRDNGRRLFSDDTELQIVGEYESGELASVLAKRYSCNPLTIRNILRRAGVFPRRLAEGPSRDILDAAIRARYSEEGPHRIASELQLSIRKVSKRAFDIGVPSLNLHARRVATRTENNPSAHFFDSWSPEVAYILGYIWTDGAVQTGRHARVHLRCVESDRQILDDIARTMGVVERPLKFFPGGKPVRGNPEYISKPQVGMTVSSQVMVSTLINTHGIIPAKSYRDPPYPQNIPDHLFHHYVRGVLDGDGSVYIDKNGSSGIVFYGSANFIDGLRNQICRVSGVRLNTIQRVRSSRHLRRIQWSGLDNLRLFDSWIYADPTSLALDRKRQKMKDIISFLTKRRETVKPRGSRWY